jgi:hypothetical protein
MWVHWYPRFLTIMVSQISWFINVYQSLSSPFRSKVAILLHAISPVLRQTYGFSKCFQIRRGHNEFTHCGQRACSAHGPFGSSADAGGTGGTGGGQRTGGVGKHSRW